MFQNHVGLDGSALNALVFTRRTIDPLGSVDSINGKNLGATRLMCGSSLVRIILRWLQSKWTNSSG
jgi:hypothetical protein